LNIHNIERYAAYNRNSIEKTQQWHLMSKELREAVKVVSLVLPFKVNKYILENLIDWNNIPNDPIYRLVFPHRDMLKQNEYAELLKFTSNSENNAELQSIVHKIRTRMNPHPAGQMSHNIPYFEGTPLLGVQHKYKETVLFFPAAGQTCHAYCTFCFRWPQFIGEPSLKFDARSSENLVKYLRQHQEVSDVLITGGDPMVMSASSLEKYLLPLLSDDLAHIKNIRIGTKAVSYWPQRFVCDQDFGEVLRLFERMTKTGRSVALMAHYNHPNELSTEIAQRAIRNIISTGATVRVQSPLIKHVNDKAQIWIDLWNNSVSLGAVPYYMFVERDTGPNEYFHLPIFKAHQIFKDAYASISGLGRTVRGPSMSTQNGKVLIDGVVDLNGEKAFSLQFIQSRNPEWVRQPFFAKFKAEATWFDQLEPFYESDRKFFANRYHLNITRSSIDNANVAIGLATSPQPEAH